MSKQVLATVVVVLLIACASFFIFRKVGVAPIPPSTPESPASTPAPAVSPAQFTLADVATHNSAASCYTAIKGNVYDLTSWIGEHPGGKKAILGICGKDGTAAFEGQHGGQARPAEELAGFQIGVVVK